MTKHLSPHYPILIIDDEPSVLDGFEIALHTVGFNNIMTCNDSREVLRILNTQKFQLVLLDLIMPHISGEDLLEKIKSTTPDLPVIIVTAVGDIGTVVQLHASWCCRLYPKAG